MDSALNAVDWVIVVVAGLVSYAGWHLGLVSRLFGWVGIGLGLYLGSKLAYVVLQDLRLSSSVLKLVVEIALIASVSVVLQSVGIGLGLKLSKILGFGPLRLIDKFAGAVFGVLTVIGLVWILIPSLANTTGAISADTRNSKIVQAIDKYLPAQPQSIQNFTQLLESGNYPQVFNSLGVSPYAGPPPQSTGVPSAIIAQDERSTVKVTGEACGYIQDGSGFSAIGNDLIVTNAHVIAGESKTYVITPTGIKLAATPIAVDEKIDLAILKVPGLTSLDPGEVPLPVVNAAIGSTVADLGHPGGVTQIVVTPARIYSQITASGNDLYNQTTVQRQVYVLSANIIQGDSGSPLVQANGQVVGIVFALAPDRPSTGYALTSQELAQVRSEIGSGPVSSGPCVAG